MKKLFLLVPMLFILIACGPMTTQAQPVQVVNPAVTAAPITDANQSAVQNAAPTESSEPSNSPMFVPMTDATPVDQTGAPVANQPGSQLTVHPTDPNATPGSDYFPPMGHITGRLSFPSSFIPPMRVAVFGIDNTIVAYTDTAKNQGTYSVDLPAGTYTVVAYPYDATSTTLPSSSSPVFAGGYTQAVPCGLTVTCTDHTLIPVTVAANQTVNADPGDWYAPEGTFPSMPGEPGSGIITGQLSFPSSFFPAMRVVAFSLTDGKAYYVDTAKNQGNYSLTVPVGNYYVVSYAYVGTAGQTGVVNSFTLGDGPSAGGYTQMVPCGLAAGCDDHTLLQVAVSAGQTVIVNPGDWYAPDGTYPPMPVQSN